MTPERRAHLIRTIETTTDARDFQGFAEALNAQGELTAELQAAINHQTADLERLRRGRR